MNKDDFIKMMENGYNSLVREETLEEKSFRLGYTYALNDLFHIIMNNDKEIERLNNIINELENIINKMMYEGYVDGFTSYYATTEHSEFGVRGKLLLDKIHKLKGDGSNE